MEFSQSQKLSPSYFKSMPEGTKFIGKLKGFKPVRDYWIGVCVLTKLPESSGSVEYSNICMDFIICKKNENTLAGLLNLKQQSKEKKLVLTFKGISKSGYPNFFHEFI